jgi:D-3-phosphoglycerate dehydrogenase
MKVLIADKFEEVGQSGLREAGCEVFCDPDLQGDLLRDKVAELNPKVLVVRSTKVPKEVLEAGADLGLVIRAGSGYNTIDIESAAARGVAVANCPGKNSEAVAELAMGLVLAVDRRIPHNVMELRKGIWNKREFSKARGLKGRRLGIVGLGKIGRLVAVRARAFEMEVIYADMVPNERMEREHGLRRVSLETLFGEADFVSLHVPLTGQTQHIVNAERLRLMKPTAVLINTSRGDVVDQAALAEALRERRIAWAALDVYEDEPGAGDKRFDSPLAGLDNLYGTHHIGASTEQAQLAVAEETVRIAKHFKETGEVLNWVNRKN